MVQVEFYLKSRAVFIDGHKEDVDLRLHRRLGAVDVLLINDVRITDHWTLRLHCADGTIQTISNAAEWLEA